MSFGLETVWIDFERVNYKELLNVGLNESVFCFLCRCLDEDYDMMLKTYKKVERSLKLYYETELNISTYKITDYWINQGDISSKYFIEHFGNLINYEYLWYLKRFGSGTRLNKYLTKEYEDYYFRKYNIGWVICLDSLNPELNHKIMKYYFQYINTYNFVSLDDIYITKMNIKREIIKIYRGLTDSFIKYNFRDILIKFGIYHYVV